MTRPGIDGRTLRSWRTRQTLIRACRLMIIAGHNRPAAIEIAQVAGASTRSLFKHFNNLGRLYAAALDDHATAALLRRLPDDPRGRALAFMSNASEMRGMPS